MDRRRILLIVATIIAALGTLLVFLYVRGADQRADSRYEAVPVLRVAKQIDPGETVDQARESGKIEMSSVASSQLLPGALETLDSIEGQIAQTTMYPGEQVVSSKFAASRAATTGLSIPKGKIAISVNLTDTARVAGFVNPGDHVAIFLNSSIDGSKTRLLLPKVEVIAVGATPTLVATTTTDAQGSQVTEQIPRTLFTLGVDQAEAEKLIFAANNGELVFGLLTEDSQIRPGPGVDARNLFK